MVNAFISWVSEAILVLGPVSGPAWTYETSIPHETFNIMEDGEVWCRGIVFKLSDVRK